MREAAPQPPQVSLDKIQSGNIRLEETRLDDAHSYAKRLHVPSEHSHANLNGFCSLCVGRAISRTSVEVPTGKEDLYSRGNKSAVLCSRYLRESEKASTPCLDRQYPPPMIDSLPRMLATFTTLPRPLFKRGRNWRVTLITPIRFTSKTFWKSSNCIQSSGPMGTDLPALFTRPHRPAEERLINQFTQVTVEHVSTTRIYPNQRCQDKSLLTN